MSLGEFTGSVSIQLNLEV